MCGITGLWLPGGHRDGAALDARALRMADRIAHRGPDGRGCWSEAESGLAFGHRRLAILDLSEAGQQPMLSRDRRWVLTYNGELYNHRSLRARLQRTGARFRGHSDSEVLVETVAALGPQAAVREFDGMFAAALWDRRDKQLWLLRDPFGEKPLYYAQINGGLLFASELRAMRADADFLPGLDAAALALYLNYGYVPAPHTIYSAARKLPAGSILRAELRDGRVALGEPALHFDAEQVARRGLANPFDGVDGMRALSSAFAESVSGRLESDVPLGAFLSGGVDSTAVVGQMCAQSDEPVRTFTVGFGACDYDESAPAAAIARHLGTDHTQFELDEQEALAHAPSIAGAYDEPFADSSQLPTALIARMARANVTVALTGDGGDELFGGYNRYVALPRINALSARLPDTLRRLLGTAVGWAGKPSTSLLWDVALSALPSSMQTPQLRSKLVKVAQMLGEDDSVSRYRRVCMLEPNPERFLAITETRTPQLNLPDTLGLDATSWMMLADTLTYLPDDILVKVDRASMWTSLETRSPFLSRALFETAWRLPSELKTGNGKRKAALRMLAERHVPKALLNRPKSGFSVPLDAWLRGPLKEWARSLIEPCGIRRDGLFNAEAVESLWCDHQRGTTDNAHFLWALVMFQSWLRAQ